MYQGGYSASVRPCLIPRWFQALLPRSNALDVSELLPMLKASCGDDEAFAAQIGDGDVDFVLEHCDKDGDQKITRHEVLPMLAMWRDLVLDIKERHVSSGNLLRGPEDAKGKSLTGSKTSSISCTLL